jgi:hypothetical protein
MNLNLDKWKKSKNWFFKWNLNLSLEFDWEQQMIEFLEKLLWKDAKYKFFIEDFHYPMGKNSNSEKLKINIKLIIFYK